MSALTDHGIELLPELVSLAEQLLHVGAHGRIALAKGSSEGAIVVLVAVVIPWSAVLVPGATLERDSDEHIVDLPQVGLGISPPWLGSEPRHVRIRIYELSAACARHLERA